MEASRGREDMDARYAALRRAVEATPAVDAHAHSLVAPGSAFPFHRCFSEAEGDVLAHAPHSLSFKRSVRDIAALYNCEASLQKVEEFRRAEEFTSISSKCFRAANISAILIDDDMPFDKMLDMESHKAFAPVVGRVLGIECLAETILNDESFSGSIWTLESLTEAYVAKLKNILNLLVTVSNQIVALKSIAACRSGLEINPNVSKMDAEDGLRKELAGQKPLRITNKNLIDYLFTRSLEISASLNLPVQIYTGSGDVDLDLGKCNPLHLRAVLDDERFAKNQLVLLHASYPFSKEASYLASVYSQVYLDFGLAISKLSVHGMTSSLKELLDRAPIKKVMFSTDGYAFPETYYLDATLRFFEWRLSLPVQRSSHKRSRREEMVMADMQIRPGEAWEYCPRNALRKVMKILLDEFNVIIKAGFENEFYLRRKLERDGIVQWVPYENTNYCSATAFDCASSMLQEVYSTLKALGIVAEQPIPGRTNHALCQRFGIPHHYTTSAPPFSRPDLYDAGTGSHVHLSLWENDKNVFMGSSEYNFHGMSKIGEHFVAGVYHHLPSILAFTTPHPNSYDRIQPNEFAGAYLCWGKENREAPIRTACPPGVPLDLVSNFEIKAFDACANPHLGLAAIIAAGIDWLRRGLKLPQPVEYDPAEYESKLKRLPQNLQESVESLVVDQVLHELIGDKLVAVIIALRKVCTPFF
nr:unnamed protein product [Digitaria exilis]